MADDAGYAGKIQIDKCASHQHKKPKDLNLLTTLDYEYVQDKFKPIRKTQGG